MSLTPAQISYLNAHHVIDQLYASGVRSLWVSPGFRNSPLIAAAQMYAKKKQDFSVAIAVDERGSGFAALGEAQATKRPVAVTCTSGTALANLYPAVLESFYGGAPLVVVSCDRPQELHSVGANQTMDQTDFFRAGRVFFAAASANDGKKQALENLRYLVAKAVAKAQFPRLGPAHLNIEFREPFAFDQATVDSMSNELLDISGPEFLSETARPSKESKAAALTKIAAAQKVLVVASLGQLGESQCNELIEIGSQKGWSLFFEAGPEAEFSRADFFLKNQKSRTESQPDLVIRFGAPLISKEISALIQNAPLGQIIFDPLAEARNPDYGKALFCDGDLDGWIRVLAEVPPVKSMFREHCIKIAKDTKNEISDLLAKAEGFTEWHASKAIAESLNGANLFLGNSMPVRDFLWIGSGFAKSGYTVFSNRGLSGIDGLLATAVGIAKNGSDTIAIIGDLSAVHDSSSFALLGAFKEKVSLTVLVMNNGGGEIFRLVDASKYPAAQESFTTPVSVDFSSLARAYGVPFCRADSASALTKVLANRRPGVSVIEVCVDRDRSTALRKDIFSKWKT